MHIASLAYRSIYESLNELVVSAFCEFAPGVSSASNSVLITRLRTRIESVAAKNPGTMAFHTCEPVRRRLTRAGVL